MNPFSSIPSTVERRGRGPLRLSCHRLVAVSILLAATAASAPVARPSQGSVDLHASFRFSGTFAPTAFDTNKDGLPAELVIAIVSGRLHGTGAGTALNTDLASYSLMVEYGLLSPADACTSCFRVQEGDYSVRENAYLGPIANLIRPIRNPDVNPSSSPYSAEEWTGFYRLESGELIFTQATTVQICVESARPPESLVPICHVKQSERILGGTGRFRHATGTATYTAIAPTYTSDAPLLDESGCIDLGARPPTFAFGPIHGAGEMSLQVPVADIR
jgi:hypothetical protein